MKQAVLDTVILKNNIQHFPMKRSFDIVFSLSVLIFFSPIFLLIGLFVFFDSPGPIFYAHKRVGRGGKKIHCWKFRTMRPNADKILKKMLNQSVQLKREWDQFYKLKNDPRITRLGKFLRKTSLDELPQFYNVLKGDLSVVGPRPVVTEEVEKYYGHKAIKILSIRPGLTGIWQTSGRNQVSFSKRIELEEEYVDTHNFFKDLYLIAKTIPVMLFAKGAF